jgi:hypothetical protein
MKLKVIFCVFILQAAFVASQQRKPVIIPVVQPYWYTLEEGKKAFREGDYGTALQNLRVPETSVKMYGTDTRVILFRCYLSTKYAVSPIRLKMSKDI